MIQAIKPFLVVFSLIVAFGAGVIVAPKINQRNFSIKDASFDKKTEKRESGFSFINPLLECEYENNQGNGSLKNIKRKTDDIIKKYPDESISIYYRDLSNGPWYGVNEDENFAPQSLLKLPVAISYVKASEDYSSLLKNKITYTEPIESNLDPKDDLILGQEYEVEYLIERILKLSDNIAFNLLATHISGENLKKTHDDLGLAYPTDDTPQDFISVKSYSSLFRVLYNSSYLYRKNSEHLLDILSQTDFEEGLVAGIPDNIIVSHKFGLLNKNNGNKQLHDCGIVYHPNQPYILCVMTRGKQLDQLKEIIKDISATIYQAVDK